MTAANEFVTSIAAATQSADDGVKSKLTGLRHAAAVDSRSNVPTRSLSRGPRSAAVDHRSNDDVEKENKTVARNQPSERKPQSASKPASEPRKKVDAPLPFTVLVVTSALAQLPNAAELVAQLGGVLVPDSKGPTVTHCVVGPWSATEKVSSVAHSFCAALAALSAAVCR